MLTFCNRINHFCINSILYNVVVVVVFFYASVATAALTFFFPANLSVHSALRSVTIFLTWFRVYSDPKNSRAVGISRMVFPPSPNRPDWSKEWMTKKPVLRGKHWLWRREKKNFFRSWAEGVGFIDSFFFKKKMARYYYLYFFRRENSLIFW